MASSAALTTTHLPTLRTLLEEWRAEQPDPTGFASPSVDISTQLAQEKSAPGKDIVVAFRTRPPLPDEAEQKFHVANAVDQDVSAADPQEGKDEDATEPERVEFCPGVTVKSAEPGTFVAHVPGWKVGLSDTVW